MNYAYIIQQLEANQETFQQLFAVETPSNYHWKQNPDKWCLLEIVCHLYDEERDDFRTRLRSVLETPGKALPMFDPVAWVTEHRYMEQNYDEMLGKFLQERKDSITWLRSLKSPKWDNAFEHPTLGPLTAHHFISNWLAHDYLHIRQITRLKYDYIKEISKNDLSYAGNWI